MGKKRTFNDFGVRLKPKATDFLVGFDRPDIGGEKKFPLSHLKNFLEQADITTITSSQDFIINSDTPVEGGLPGDGLPPPPSFVNGKIFHAKSDNDMVITLPKMVQPETLEMPMLRFTLVNLSEGAVVEIRTQLGSLQARGSILRKKFDAATIYYDGSDWYAYGDLDRTAGLDIQKVTTDYTFSRADSGKLLHFYPTQNTKLNLPAASEFRSGIQFYVYNFSEFAIELDTMDESELMARAIFLRRKYDDAVVYTDGEKWFATGDLS